MFKKGDILRDTRAEDIEVEFLTHASEGLCFVRVLRGNEARKNLIGGRWLWSPASLEFFKETKRHPLTGIFK